MSKYGKHQIKLFLQPLKPKPHFEKLVYETINLLMYSKRHYSNHTLPLTRFCLILTHIYIYIKFLCARSHVA